MQLAPKKLNENAKDQQGKKQVREEDVRPSLVTLAQLLGHTSSYATQFSEMSQAQGQKVADVLLRNCELDTLAMVLIWEYWAHDLLKRSSKKAA